MGKPFRDISGTMTHDMTTLCQLEHGNILWARGWADAHPHSRRRHRYQIVGQWMSLVSLVPLAQWSQLNEATQC